MTNPFDYIKELDGLLDCYQTNCEALAITLEDLGKTLYHYSQTINQIRTLLEEIPVDDKSADAIARMQKLLDEALSKPPEPKLKGE